MKVKKPISISIRNKPAEELFRIVTILLGLGYVFPYGGTTAESVTTHYLEDPYFAFESVNDEEYSNIHGTNGHTPFREESIKDINELIVAHFYSHAFPVTIDLEGGGYKAVVKPSGVHVGCTRFSFKAIHNLHKAIVAMEESNKVKEGKPNVDQSPYPE